ncbi:MAG: L-fucose:H+ symporter permease [Bacteroidales bacterium]|nr:L-fucose:H+ symporter permease [Bacteroidales bacterium]
MTKETTTKAKMVTRDYLLSFILVTLLFPLWGFANDITNPMVRAFSKVLLMSNFQGSLVQFAFYGGYFAMAFVAAYFIKKYSYKNGIVLGLALYATGAFLFFPSSLGHAFWPFLVSYFILTCGLSFLETSANPYILSMGDPATATRRLNFAQSFNPMGSLLGMFTAQQLILSRLNNTDNLALTKLEALDPAKYSALTANPDKIDFKAVREAVNAIDPAAFEAMRATDLVTIRNPYLALGAVVLLVMIIFLIAKMPKKNSGGEFSLKDTLGRLLRNKRYYEGVIAQFFYVGVQIMCWTFIIHYAEIELGIDNATAQKYNIVAMLIFLLSRFICTFLLKYVRPGQLLKFLSFGGMALVLGVIFIKGMTGLYCLIGVSACMSLMFPTIYGIALEGIGEDAEFGAAGLIMAILGGSVMPPLQALMIDQQTILGISGCRFSFILPFICFVVIAIYGHRNRKLAH